MVNYREEGVKVKAIQGFILYKIYYGDGLVYLGRTKQPLQNRIRGHVFKKPMHRSLDINLITKIEYAEFKTEADMFLYEVFYINKLKPPLNVDDKARDEITVKLPSVDFKLYSCHLWESWQSEINNRNGELQIKSDRYYCMPEKMSILRNQFREGKIEKEEFEIKLDDLKREKKELEKYLFGRG